MRPFLRAAMAIAALIALTMAVHAPRGIGPSHGARTPGTAPPPAAIPSVPSPVLSPGARSEPPVRVDADGSGLAEAAQDPLVPAEAPSTREEAQRLREMIVHLLARADVSLEDRAQLVESLAILDRRTK